MVINDIFDMNKFINLPLFVFVQKSDSSEPVDVNDFPSIKFRLHIFPLTFSASALTGAGEAAGALLHSIGSGGTDSDSEAGCSGSSPGGFGTTIFSLSASEFSTGPVTPGTSSACHGEGYQQCTKVNRYHHSGEGHKSKLFT